MPTRYLNTDLDIVSTQPLDILARALKCGKLTCINDWEDNAGLFHQGWEVLGSNNFQKPSQAIELLILVIESLPESPGAIWNACQSKAFDIGYSCAEEPWGFHQELPSELLMRMALLKISLRLTLYPEHPPGHKKKKPF